MVERKRINNQRLGGDETMNRGRAKRALVVDDDQEIRTAIKAALTRAGYDVEASEHLPSAVGAGLSGDYAVITLVL